MTRKTVILYNRLAPTLRARLDEHFHVLDFSDTPNLPRDPAFRAALEDAHGVLGASVPLGRAELAHARNLEAISSVSVGVDKYDRDYLVERGIMLCHTPDVLTETTADTAFLLMLAAARRAVELAMRVRNGEWTASVGEADFGVDVHGKRLGIVGMGRIGAAIGRRARFGFNMDVAYHNRSRHAAVEDELGAEWRTLDDLLDWADFVCVTVPLAEATRGLFGAAEFQRMGPETIFINISRGGVVDEPALIAALENHTIRAAGLDVFTTEPLPGDSPLARLANVVALPHIGSATHETRHAMAALAVDNLIEALAGREPPARYSMAD
ncbi:D-glycerate dehydrogenase [Salinisphaera sp.]|uniref:2-hydroxyacid dehydrogenase n=1 Tax=Salinisphaera sp. TaxID=1914330 RepID=UPI002D77E3C1|nr:D-glycerate dehydrogenase [Salinisphaera sp.]HET7313582.1 D-glycerate dehydrogenase [Salinisphaera sp.]